MKNKIFERHQRLERIAREIGRAHIWTEELAAAAMENAITDLESMLKEFDPNACPNSR